VLNFDEAVEHDEQDDNGEADFTFPFPSRNKFIDAFNKCNISDTAEIHFLLLVVITLAFGMQTMFLNLQDRKARKESYLSVTYLCDIAYNNMFEMGLVHITVVSSLDKSALTKSLAEFAITFLAGYREGNYLQIKQFPNVTTTDMITLKAALLEEQGEAMGSISRQEGESGVYSGALNLVLNLFLLKCDSRGRGRPVGFATLLQDYTKTHGILGFVATKTNGRITDVEAVSALSNTRQHICKRLFNFVVTTFHGDKILFVDPKNLVAINTYNKLGWHRVSIVSAEYETFRPRKSDELVVFKYTDPPR